MKIITFTLKLKFRFKKLNTKVMLTNPITLTKATKREIKIFLIYVSYFAKR